VIILSLIYSRWCRTLSAHAQWKLTLSQTKFFQVGLSSLTISACPRKWLFSDEMWNLLYWIWMIISTFSSVCIPLRSAALYRGFQIKILRILIKTATAAMIMWNFHHSSQSRATTSCSTQQHCNNTTAMAATIMWNSHESHQTHATDYGNGRNDCAESSHDGKTRATHYGNHHNDYTEFSHEGHQTHATHYGNGRNDCVESSHGKTCATHITAMAATIMRNSHESHQTPQHTTATAATIMWNFHMKATKLATQHTMAMAATIVWNLHTMVPPKLTQHTQWQLPQQLCGIFVQWAPKNPSGTNQLKNLVL